MKAEDKQNILNVYEEKPFVVGNTVCRFARQTKEDADEIEKMSDRELISQWKSLVWLNEIYGQVSLNDMERISLIECEMSGRKKINEGKTRLIQNKKMREYRSKRNETSI